MKAIIVEDEVLAREELRYLIETHSKIKVEAEFEDGLDALKFLQNQEVDVLFLDINIPSIDGVLLAHNISKFSVKPYIVFITAYKEHAVEAFEVEAFDYILKPYSESRIFSMLARMEAAHTQQHRAIPKQLQPSITKVNLYKNEKIIVVDANDIYYAVAQEKTTEVVTKSEKYIMHLSISDFYERLPKDIFFRCHRSYLVNTEKIKEIVPWFNNTYLLRLNDIDAEIPVSRSKSKEFRQLMRL